MQYESMTNPSTLTICDDEKNGNKGQSSREIGGTSDIGYKGREAQCKHKRATYHTVSPTATLCAEAARCCKIIAHRRMDFVGFMVALGVGDVLKFASSFVA